MAECRAQFPSFSSVSISRRQMASSFFFRLGTVLTESTNRENRDIALAWWEQYRYLWE